MTYVRPRPLWLVLLPYIAGGIAFALALPALRMAAGNAFAKRALGNFYVINIALPLLVVALAAWYPRMRAALLGALTLSLAFLLTAFTPNPQWNVGWLSNYLVSLSPIVIVACLAYPVLGAVTVGVVRWFRRVGPPPDPTLCRACGYSLIGLPEPRCPECGSPFDPHPQLQVAPNQRE